MTDAIAGVFMVFYILLFDPTALVDQTVPPLYLTTTTQGVQR